MKNVFDVKREKKMNYILPVQWRLNEDTDEKKLAKAAVIIHLHYLDTLDIYLKYMQALPLDMDFFLTLSNQELKEAVEKSEISRRENFRIITKQNRGRDVSAFLVACRKEILAYEYICFLHDKKEYLEIDKEDMAKWIRCLWENMIGSTEYIRNVLQTFDRNPRLGLLVPPLPMSEHFRMLYATSWGINYDETEALASKMCLKCNLDRSKPPITLGTVFWAKVTALRKLFELDWKYEDFDEEPRKKSNGTITHAIERILAYVAQDAGYETGWVMTDRYAAEMLENMQEVLEKAFGILDHSVYIKYISELNAYETKLHELSHFVNRYNHLYVYGAGECARKCLAMLRQLDVCPDAFLVSDMEQNPKKIQDIPVCSIETVHLNDNCGVIVGTSERYHKEIVKIIKNRAPLFPNIYLYKLEIE